MLPKPNDSLCNTTNIHVIIDKTNAKSCFLQSCINNGRYIRVHKPKKRHFLNEVSLFSKGGVYRYFPLTSVHSLRFSFGVSSLCIICHSFLFLGF